MTDKLVQDQPTPNFSFNATSNLTSDLAQYKGKNVVIYFYPKDSTPGCTHESKDFRDLYPEFEQANTVILGVSKDSLTSHEKFKKKHELPFELISDPDEKICKLFEVIRPKNIFGKSLIGIIRSTFIIDKEGNLAHSLRKVKVKGHAQEVLDLIKALK